jgi:chitin synthase
MFGLPLLASNPGLPFVSQFAHADFVARYNQVVSLWDRNHKNACETLIRNKNWRKTEAVVGETHIYLSEFVWRGLEIKLKEKIASDEQRALASKAASEAQSSTKSAADEAHAIIAGSFGNVNSSEYAGSEDSASQFDSEFDFHAEHVTSSRLGDIELGNLSKGEFLKSPKEVAPEPVKKMSSLRCQWLAFVWATTWIYPSFCLRMCGRMRDKDRQLAWREKVALCVIVFFMNATILFFIIGLGLLLCQRTNALSIADINSLNKDGPKAGK